ncbi:ATP-grasp domain-containing protein [uncultured Draconibacterium sp.]|uniref:ATP-grasp domain-containing protein n=1 Tax=uncultured Draconibacterium sp. TaxID=1573823 RepID=UPI003217D73E
MAKKIGIFGFTPREEVIVDKIKKQNPEIFITLFSDSLNITLQKRVNEVLRISDDTLNNIKSNHYDFILLGPEKYSSEGIHEKLLSKGVNVIGCNRNQIQIETDKTFLKHKSFISNSYFPSYKIIKEFNKDLLIKSFNEFGNFVIKYPDVYPIIGGGTRVYSQESNNIKDALDYSKHCIQNCGKVLIEKYIDGIDFSVNAISAKDGSIFFFSDNFCYKRRDNYDMGPNTSGTGSYAYSNGLPFLTNELTLKAHSIVKSVVKDCISYFKTPFISGLNVDFRKGTDNEIYLLEVNARFAGAGTLSTVVDLCENNLYNILQNSVKGSFENIKLKTNSKCSLGVFVYPPYFPDDREEHIITRIPKVSALPDSVNLYTGWVNIKNETESEYLVELMNSTTLLYQNKGNDLKKCRKEIYDLLINLPAHLEYRKDIGDV